MHEMASWAERNAAHVTFVELDAIERINSDVLGDMPRPSNFHERVTSIAWPCGFDYIALSDLSDNRDLVARVATLEARWHADTRFSGLVRSQVYRSLHPRLRRIGVRNQRHPIVEALAPYLIRELALLQYLKECLGVDQEISMHPHRTVRDYIAQTDSPINLPTLISLKGETHAEAPLRLEDTIVTISKLRTVGPISLAVEAGEVIGLLGVNGSGKTTLLRAIGGHLPICSGRLIVHGRVVNDLPAYDRGIATVFQDGGLFPDRTAEANVEAGLRKAKRSGTEARAVDGFTAFKAQFPTADFWSHLPAELSGGQKQLAAMARALAVGPDIILLDEPSASLDHIRKRLLISLIKSHVAARKCSAILISHDMEVLLALCDRFLVISESGEQIADIPARDFVDNGRSMTAARILGLPNIFDTRIGVDGAPTFVEQALRIQDPSLVGDENIHGIYLPPAALISLAEHAPAPLGIEICGWLNDRIAVPGGELLFLRAEIGDEQSETLMVRTPPNLVSVGDTARVRLVIPTEKVRLMSR